MPYNYDRLRHLNFMGYGHFNHGNGYNTHADYDTNAPSIEHWLGKTNAYLHYLDHIFSEMIEAISDLLKRISDLEELLAYKHVPSKLVKADEKHDYIKVLNENRTQADGLAEGLVDTLQQKHIMDTSKLDSIIENIVNNVGLETIIKQNLVPADKTCIDLGDISKFKELKVTYDSSVFSIPRVENYVPIQFNKITSFTFSNIVDEQDNYLKANGEIGQVLATLKGNAQKAQMCFDNSQIWRFENVSKENGSWNRQDGFAFSTVKFPFPAYGNGWIHIIKISGFTYALKLFEEAEEIVLYEKENGVV